MALLAHGGTVGLILELTPALVLAAIGVAVWRKQRSAASDESGVEERGGDGQ